MSETDTWLTDDENTQKIPASQEKAGHPSRRQGNGYTIFLELLTLNTNTRIPKHPVFINHQRHICLNEVLHPLDPKLESWVILVIGNPNTRPVGVQIGADVLESSLVFLSNDVCASAM